MHGDAPLFCVFGRTHRGLLIHLPSFRRTRRGFARSCDSIVTQKGRLEPFWRVNLAGRSMVRPEVRTLVTPRERLSVVAIYGACRRVPEHDGGCGIGASAKTAKS